MGPVVRTPVSANPGLNFNPGFFFLLSKAHCRIFSLFFLEYPITKLKAKRIKLNLPFKLSYPSSNFTLTVGYLNPASNNPALGMSLTCFGSEYRMSEHFTCFTANYCLKAQQEQQEDNSTDDICDLENICRSEQSFFS